MSQGALASKTSTPSSRVAGGATRVAAASQPVAQRHAKPYSGLAPSPVGIEALDAGQQDLLDGALDRAHGEALLEDAVGVDLVEAREGAAQARRRGRPGAALAGQGDGGGDVVGLLEGRAQRLDLVEVELAVAAGRAARLGIAEAPLP